MNCQRSRYDRDSPATNLALYNLPGAPKSAIRQERRTPSPIELCASYRHIYHKKACDNVSAITEAAHPVKDERGRKNECRIYTYHPLFFNN